jgi:alkyl hydroperoxide reductase subunit AhpC
MFSNKFVQTGLFICSVVVFLWIGSAGAENTTCTVYPVGELKPRDSISTLKLGDKAPDFTLTAVGGGKISMNQYLGKKNIVISFVPAAWTPVCTSQWPVYDLAKEIFHNNDAILLGITVDNIPTLYAWTKEILPDRDPEWFPILSDFFPHGEVAKKYGVLRSEGFTERALFVIDKKGIIRFIDIHDINERPPLMELKKALEEIN